MRLLLASEGFDEETRRSPNAIISFEEVAMAINWGPQYIVPSETLKSFSGRVLLRETFDEALLRKELVELGIPGDPIKATNPWYCRKKDTETWIKIGESSNKKDNFAVPWDTTKLGNGEYQVLGLMHVWVRKDDKEVVVARQNIVDVTVEN
jgi:hypothetical protein